MVAVFLRRHLGSQILVSKVRCKSSFTRWLLTRIIKLPVVIRSQMIDSPLRVPNSSRVDGQDRTSPSSDILVRPDFPNLVRSPTGHSLIHGRRIREYALQHDEASRITVESWVLPPRGVEAIVDSVKAVDLGWFGEVLGYSCPVFGDGETKLLLPLTGDVESISPVGHLVGEIKCSSSRRVLGDTDGAAKVSFSNLIPKSDD